MRNSNLSLVVDADHAYGNALNAMRCVQELEHAGVSCMSIEDTVLPRPFGQKVAETYTSIEEGAAKLRAAVSAKQDPAFMIAGRSSSLKSEGLEGALARFKAYEKTGVDAIFVVGLESLEQIKAINAAVKLPIIVGSAPASIKREDLAPYNVKIMLQGHQPVAAAVKALQDCYSHLFKGGAPADLKSKIASNEEMEKLLNADLYKKWQQDYLK
jgi:carboxyvinyl-carboxyphosphonate phosphorylmutase